LFKKNPHPLHLCCHCALVLYVYPIKELFIKSFLSITEEKLVQNRTYRLMNSAQIKLEKKESEIKASHPAKKIFIEHHKFSNNISQTFFSLKFQADSVFNYLSTCATGAVRSAATHLGSEDLMNHSISC